jgi:hypothetical protein
MSTNSTSSSWSILGAPGSSSSSIRHYASDFSEVTDPKLIRDFAIIGEWPHLHINLLITNIVSRRDSFVFKCAPAKLPNTH